VLWSGRLRGLISSPGRGKIFLRSMSSRPALGHTQPSIQWVPGVLSLWAVQWPAQRTRLIPSVSYPSDPSFALLLPIPFVLETSTSRDLPLPFPLSLERKVRLFQARTHLSRQSRQIDLVLVWRNEGKQNCVSVKVFLNSVWVFSDVSSE
jgi:hypothetical protein